MTTKNCGRLGLKAGFTAICIAGILTARVQAAPDGSTTNNGVVIYQGNQSQGVTNIVTTSSPATVVVTNLTTDITPFPGGVGIQVSGTETNRNVTLSFDGSGAITTTGDNTYGIHVINAGVSVGAVALVTNSYTITTNVVNGTNVVTITTNFESGGSNVYTASIPVGGVIVSNAGTINTSGNGAHGIFAESQPGSIGFSFSNTVTLTQPYGNAGSVNVANSGNITTIGTNAYGIFAQSIGGLGPEDSPTSGNGGDVSVSTQGGTIFTEGTNSYGIFAQSHGGDNQGGESGGAVHDGSNGGLGGNGGNVAVTGSGTITTIGDNATGVFALSQAGNGGPGGNAGTLGGSGGDGGNGGQASNVTVSGNWNITTYGTNASGIVAQSLGGIGGNGGGGSPFINLGAGNGGGTANGGDINVTSAGIITILGSNSLGILARSVGGFAGNGGSSYTPFYGGAGDGNSAGAGGNVSVVNGGAITTVGDDAQAIYAESVGGGGGAAGTGHALVTEGASGGAGGNGGTATVTNFATLLTFGSGSSGIEAQSLGGGGGDGGNAGGLVALGGTGGTGSTSSVVTIYNIGMITTHGSNANGILGQSIGGGGGNAGDSAGVSALGGSGNGGGNGAAVNIFNGGGLTTTGSNSYGILAQSIGGGGGNGGGGSGLSAVGGSGGAASQSDVVNVFNMGAISSTASSIFAQSIGGGGGNGGNGGGWFSVGGSGNGGGNGAGVYVTNFGNLQTSETNASAIFAQSVGGGGGNGGDSVAAGAFASVAVGGNGALGGNGDVVNVVSGTNTITTTGDNAFGIDAESVGGGGGKGGYAVSASVGEDFSAAIAIGGQGGGGGNSSNVSVISASDITTTGTNSHGIFAQSVGGGGGSGGFAVAISGSSGASVSLAMGGAGGSGGSAGTVTVNNSGTISTAGDHSYGILAQSVGGGGGDGGFSISGGFSADGSASLSFGGSGKNGGSASNVMVFNSGVIQTTGDDAHAIEVQSVGGGGGSGGFSVAGSVSAGGTLGASFGGSGAGGGNGEAVGLTNAGALTTYGDGSYGILAQSLGGGGGNGGFSVAGDVSKSPALSLSMGGSGAGGGNGSTVTVANSGDIATYGQNAHGIFAQSLGGGGGAGGFSISGSISQGASASLSIGGTGAGGGSADAVNVTNSGDIVTQGTNSYGILAQSVGGGGGEGGFSVAGDIGKGPATSFTMGGAGGSGNFGGAVSVFNTGNITTYGALSYGIFAQSLGGGGGAGGFSISGTVVQNSSGLSMAIGGEGGPGDDGSAVALDNTGRIVTTNEGSHAIFAESVGGGGGAGGFAGSLTGNFGNGSTLSVAIGGTGGSGGAGGAVNVTNSGTLITQGDGSTGIYAQSVGGGGGDGGFGLAAAFGTSQKGKNASLAIGGNGGAGGYSSNVTVFNTGNIETQGSNSTGIFAQSLGGGGGSGGFAAAGSFGTGSNQVELSVSIGGAASNGNYAGSVFVTNTGVIVTSNYNSVGILAQSIGGSGGTGGMSFTGSISAGGGSKDVALSVGGQGGTGGNADLVDVMTSGNIMTTGDLSHGIFAQSVGGGGGSGGLAVAVDLSLGTTNPSTQFAVAIGGSGGAGGTGSNVFVGGTNIIVTTGQGSYGVFAQSVGGGGGAGGMSVAATGVIEANQGTNRALAITVGGDGGAGNNAGNVTVDRVGDIMTLGDGSYGIMAQSVGGGGGDGGGARSFSLFTKGGGAEETNTSSKSIDVSIGGNGAGSGQGGIVTITNVGNITTEGADAYGIFAQSIGGGGGSGGAAHSSTDDLIPVPIPQLNDQAVEAISTDSSQYQVTVGGQAGSSGNGSNVVVNQTGNITTMSDGSYGIFAQSVGAGGGVGGNGVVGQDGQLGIGGSGGASGSGGAVTVTVNGNITTLGAGAAGIFAQSVGGGGGVAGNVDRGQDDLNLEISKAFAVGESGGSAGDGSTVTVNSTGNITTAGNGAYGIFAQSVGGGGGLVGDLGNDVPGLSFLTDFAGSVGGAGNGGNVSITHTGIITTYGSNSAGIFAQSAGGTNGTSGNVNVTINGAIYANGVNSDGIYAQSGGGATVVQAPVPTAPPPVPVVVQPLTQGGLFAQSVGGGGGIGGFSVSGAIPGLFTEEGLAEEGFALPIGGNVMVVVSSNSMVQGGTGNSAGVRFVDGDNNTLMNYGYITTLSGLNGTTISGTNGNNYIYNYGLIEGSVDLGTDLNQFNNMSNGTLIAGNTIAIGQSNIFYNSGTIALGDSNTIMRTAMTGNLEQDANGSMQVKLASATNYDALAVNGWASLSGNLSVFRYTNYLPLKGNEFTVLTATNVSGQFSSLSDPYLGNYAIRLDSLYSATNVVLQVVQDSFLKFAATGNQRSVAANLNTFSGVGTTNGDPRGAALIAYLDTQTSAQLEYDMELISPDAFGALFDLNFASVSQDVGNVQQRMGEIRNGNHIAGGSISMYNPRGQQLQIASADHALPVMNTEETNDGWSAFAAGNGQYVDVPGNDEVPGYHFHSAGVTLGLDKMVRTNLAIGFTLDYAGTEASIENGGTVGVDGGRGGFYGTWFQDNNYVEGSFGGGFNHYSTMRTALGGTAIGDTDGFEFDGMLGGGHDFKRGDLLFGPLVNVQYTFVQVDEFTESGSLAPLHLENNDSQSLLSHLGAHMLYNWQMPHVTLRPELALAWQHEYLDRDRAIDSQLASGAGTIFRVNSPEVGRDSVTVDVNLGMQWTKQFSTFLSYHGDLARQDYTAHSVSGGLTIGF